MQKLLYNIARIFILPRTSKSNEVNLRDATLIYYMANNIKINFPSLMISHLSDCISKRCVIGYGGLLTWVFRKWNKYTFCKWSAQGWYWEQWRLKYWGTEDWTQPSPSKWSWGTITQYYEHTCSSLEESIHSPVSGKGRIRNSLVFPNTHT